MLVWRLRGFFYLERQTAVHQPGALGYFCHARAKQEKVMRIAARRSFIISEFACLFILALVLAGAARGQTASGFPPFNAFQNGQFDMVNLANVNVHFSIPVFHRAGPGLPFGYDLTYDSTIFSATAQGGGFFHQSNWGWNPIGSTSTMGYIITTLVKGCSGDPNASSYNNWFYIDAAGTAHPFPTSFIVSTDSVCAPTQATASSTDGAAYVITVTTSNSNPSLVSLYDASGNKFNVPISSWTVGATTGISASITDPNGNSISTPDGLNFTDTLGTTALSTSTSNNLNNGNIISATYTFPGPNGSVSLVVNYKTYPAVSTHFNCPNEVDIFDTGSPVAFSGVPLVDNIVLPDGGKYTFSYEPTPNPTKADPPGSVTARITSVGLPTGGTITYAYSGPNNGINCADGSPATLTRTTPDGQWTYAHSVSGTSGTTTVTDPKGNQTVVTTQSGFETERQVYQGSVSSNVLLDTVVTCYNGNPSPCTTAANTTAVTPPLTQVTALTQLENSGQNGMVTSASNVSFNSNGLASELDEYDVASGANPGALVRKTTVAYNASLGNIVNRPATVTVFDGSNNQVGQTTYTYNSLGNQTGISRAVNTSSTVQSSATFNSNGTLSTSADFNGNQTSYTYGSGSCNGAFPTSVSEPDGLSRSMTWNCNGGVMTSSTDENNQTTSFGYADAQYWRLTSVNYPDSGQTSYSYNSATAPWNITQSTKITSTQTLSVNTIYDSLGRVLQRQVTSDPAGTDTVVTTYDGNGLVASVSNPYRRTSDPTYGITQYSYDALGRMTKQTQPDGSAVQWSYSANCMTQTDEAGKISKICDDGLGRTSVAYEPDSSNGLNWETDYSHDVLNNLTGVTQKGGSSNSSQWRTRSFAYDGLSRLTQSVTPEAGTTIYAYTTTAGFLCSGNPSLQCSRTDARGIITTFTYDVLNRLTGKTYSDSTPTVTYSYDQTSFDGLTITHGKGRRTGMTDGSGETAWSYDAVGRIVTHQQTIAGFTKSIVSSYNLDGSIASITYPSGRTYTYGYDGAQHPTSLVDSANNISFVSNTQYNAPGLLTSAVHGAVPGWNAITETNSYNNRLQPTQLEAVSPVPLTLLNLSFSYSQAGGNNGNVVQIANNRDSTRSVNYTYDQLSRLSSAQTYQATTWGNSYAYDPWGNLLQMTVTQGTAQNLSVSVNSKNQVTSPAFTYDAGGDVTWDTVNAMKYDAEGRMNPVTGTVYTYDGNDRRVEKSSGTVYWVDDEGRPVSVGTTSGSITRDYVFFGGKRIALVSLSSGNPYYYLSDQINSTAVIASGDGKTIQWEADYFPFGSVRKTYTNNLENDYLFTGDQYDYETGYNYAVARYLSGQFGRFLRPDPSDGSMEIADPQSMNRYAYVRNNPVNLSDPFGLDDGGGGCDFDCGGGDGGCDFGCGNDGGGIGGIVAPPLNLTGPGFYEVLGVPGFGVLNGQTPGLPVSGMVGLNSSLNSIFGMLLSGLGVGSPACEFSSSCEMPVMGIVPLSPSLLDAAMLNKVPLLATDCAANNVTGDAYVLTASWGTPGCALNDIFTIPSSPTPHCTTTERGVHCYEIHTNQNCTTTICPGETRSISGDCDNPNNPPRFSDDHFPLQQNTACLSDKPPQPPTPTPSPTPTPKPTPK